MSAPISALSTCVLLSDGAVCTCEACVEMAKIDYAFDRLFQLVAVCLGLVVLVSCLVSLPCIFRRSLF